LRMRDHRRAQETAVSLLSLHRLERAVRKHLDP
jgi:hypothetical protein